MLALSCGAAETLVVTAFKPFMGRGKNGSETILASLRSAPELTGVRFVVLEVGWGGVDGFVKTGLAPEGLLGVIGIGEGFPGVVAIETRGRNVADGVDEAGIARHRQPIDPALPEANRSRIRFAISGADHPLPIVINNNAGEFLCNYALFRYNQLPVAVSGFIHVPPQGTVDDAAYIAAVRPIVLDIIRQNLSR